MKAETAKLNPKEVLSKLNLGTLDALKKEREKSPVIKHIQKALIRLCLNEKKEEVIIFH